MEASRRGVLAGGAGLAVSLLGSGRARAQAGEVLRRVIPSTGETLPVIGLGTAGRWMSAGTDTELAALRETLRLFHAEGGTVIDTSDDYGMAEDVVGRLTQELGIRDSLFLATKVSTTGRGAGTRQTESSFRRLRAPRIDLNAVHNLEDTATNLGILRDLKRAGRIRYVGVTVWHEGQHGALEAVMRREPLDFVQVDYALDARRSGERILPLARERGMAIMVNVPFGRGRLFARARDKPAMRRRMEGFVADL